jgi:hypothetical protein
MYPRRDPNVRMSSEDVPGRSRFPTPERRMGCDDAGSSERPAVGGSDRSALPTSPQPESRAGTLASMSEEIFDGSAPAAS